MGSRECLPNSSTSQLDSSDTVAYCSVPGHCTISRLFVVSQNAPSTSDRAMINEVTWNIHSSHWLKCLARFKIKQLVQSTDHCKTRCKIFGYYCKEWYSLVNTYTYMRPHKNNVWCILVCPNSQTFFMLEQTDIRSKWWVSSWEAFLCVVFRGYMSCCVMNGIQLQQF